MKTHRLQLPSFARLAISEALIVTFVLLLCMPVGFATSRESTSPRNFKATLAPLAGLIEVNVTSDGDNLSPSVGCDSDANLPGEQCSLRAAIQRANFLAGDDEIRFNIPTSQPNCDTSVGHCLINLTQSLPPLATNVLIRSPNKGLVTLRRSSISEFRIFTVTSASEVTISGIRMEGGKPAGVSSGGAIANAGDATVNLVDCSLITNFAGASGGSGGAIFNDIGTVNVIDTMIIDNRATVAGAGIYNAGSGTVNVTGSIIFQNTVTVPLVANAAGGGGAIANATNGTVSINNTVIGDNLVTSAGTAVLTGAGVWNMSTGSVNVVGSSLFNNRLLAGNGGGIANASGSLHVSNSTIINNRGIGGGVYGQATVNSSIIAQNNNGSLAGVDVSGTFNSEGFNFIGVADGSTGFTQPSDLKGSTGAPLDPKFDPNGAEMPLPGLPLPMPGQPLCDSPVIDKGTANGLTTDLRGANFTRTVDDPNETNASDGTDIGALERQSICVQVTFVVDNTGDADDANPGDGVCDSDSVASGSQCSLRAALKESNAVAGDYTINFAIPTSDPGFDPGAGSHTINLTGPLPDITNSNLTINGPGKNKLTVRRNTGGFYRIFNFSGLVETLTLQGMTITNGFNPAGDGGALSFVGKSAAIKNVDFSNNVASGAGGAINVYAALTIADSSFTSNFSSSAHNQLGGGAVLSRGALNVSNSTFIDNVANSLGGAINSSSLSGDGDSSITDCVFTGNEADAGGGVSTGAQGVVMRISNSKFTRNSSTILNSKGGGIYHLFGNLEVSNSTLSDNEGYGIASNVANGSASMSISNTSISGNTFGGIETEFSTVATSKLNITNSTITGNTGGPGLFLSRVTLNVSNSTISHNEIGGIRNTLSTGSGTWTVKSSIIALNGTSIADVSGAYVSGGFNLIGNMGTSTGFANGVNNDQVGTSGASLDPKLDPSGLKDNGGPTHTIALLPDSPAIDKGTSDALNRKLDNDQRQVFARTFDDAAIANAADGTDVGAFELQPGGPTPTPTPTPTPNPSPSPLPSPNPSPSPSPNPTPSPTPTPANLVLTVTSLVRSNCGSISVGVTVQNVGGTAANNVRLTTGTLSPPTTDGTPLPKNFGNLAPGQWATTVITFSGTNNPKGKKRTLTFGGMYNGGTFTEEWTVNLP